VGTIQSTIRGAEHPNPWGERAMKRIPTLLTMTFAFTLAVVAVGTISAQQKQDKYTLKVPDGLAFADFRGYEGWEVVSVARTDEVLKVIVANPVMIEAYKSGIPGNGKPFPDGSKIAKIQWIPKKSAEAPFDVNVPDHLKDLFFIEKDSKRFPDIGGWGYALFDYDAASDTFKPNGSGVNCGTACHTIVKTKDYIFHPYQKR
jgi:cytochrome P460